MPGWAALAAACLGQLMSVLDGTIVNVALPALRRSLQLGVVDLQWVINAYLLAFGGLLLLGGRLGDHFGRKRVYLVGAVIFLLASVAGGLAPNGVTLIIARAVQGVGAALLTPGTLSLLAAAYPEPRARGRALGIWSATQGVGASAGVLLGGVLTDTLGWRWVFFVNIPIGIVVIVLGGLALVESRGDDDRAARLDVPGAVLITVAMSLLVYAVVDTDRYAWGSLHTLIPLEGSVVALIAFLIVEVRVRAPLIPFAIVRRPAVAVGVLVISLFGAMLTSTYYFLSLYLQGPRGLNPLDAGLAFLPSTVVSIGASSIGPGLCARFGPRRPLFVGLACSTVGMVWLSRFGAHSDLVSSSLLPSAVFGIGIGTAFVCVTVLVTAGVESAHTGLASGLINAGRQIGGSIGLAVLSVIAAARTREVLAAHSGSVAAAGASGYGVALLVGAGLGLTGLLVVASSTAARAARGAALPATGLRAAAGDPLPAATYPPTATGSRAATEDPLPAATDLPTATGLRAARGDPLPAAMDPPAAAGSRAAAEDPLPAATYPPAATASRAVAEGPPPAATELAGATGLQSLADRGPVGPPRPQTSLASPPTRATRLRTFAVSALLALAALLLAAARRGRGRD
jgi:EmrB/QacA subfamily drug resistance transporter